MGRKNLCKIPSQINEYFYKYERDHDRFWTIRPLWPALGDVEFMV